MLQDQDDLQSNQISNDAETGAALDRLLEDAMTPQNTNVKTPVESAPAAPAVSETPAANEPNTDTLPEHLPAETAETDQAPEPRVPAADSPAQPAEAPDPSLKAFDEVKLRPDASQKTKDTFANLKKIAYEQVQSERAAKQQLLKQLEELRSKPVQPSNELPEEVKTELENLRKYKAEFDIENDPEFKKQLESRVEPRKTSNYESIYDVLRSHSLPESEVKALKELSEADRVAAIGDFVEKLPRMSKMKIEAKLLDNLNLDDEKGRAIAEAREKAAANRAQFREAPEKIRERTMSEVRAAAETHRTHDIFKRAEIAATVPPEDRKRLEAANAHAERLNKLYEEAVNDDSPKARAENAFGLVLAHHFKAQLDAAQAEKAKLASELAEIKKRGSTAAVGRVVNVPSTGRPAVTTLDAGTSLDNLAREAGLLA